MIGASTAEAVKDANFAINQLVPSRASKPEGYDQRFQHFAAGVVFAAVAINSCPSCIERPLPMVVGFSGRRSGDDGEQAMVRSSRDACTDRGRSVHRRAPDRDRADGGDLWRGWSPLAGLTIEALSLGLASTPALVRDGASGVKAIAIIGGLGLMILLGATAGYASVGASPPVLAAILGFGGPALRVYLVWKAHTARSIPNISQDEEGMQQAVQAVLLSRRHSEPCRAGDARLDPRRRRTRLRAVARLRRGLRQSRSDRRLRRRRRRGGDRAARGELALEQVPEPGARRRGAADPASERLQDRRPDGAGAHRPTKSWTACSTATATSRTSSKATSPQRCTS